MKLIIISFILIFSFSCDNCDSDYRGAIKKERVYGVISSFYLDNENHMTPTFLIGDNKKIRRFHGLSELYNNVSMGDTLRKDSNSLDFYLIKKDTVLVFNPKCGSYYVY